MDATDRSAASAQVGTGETGPRCQLLGEVRAWRGDDEIDLGSAHRRAVLAVLALSAGHTVSRDDLIDALWGNEPPTSASGSIYTYVSALRQALEPGRAKRSGGTLLASVGSGYSLRIDRADIDVHRFTALRTRAANTSDHRTALADLDTALGLWQGDALTGIPGPFAQAQRAKLAELRLAAVEHRAELLIELDRPDEPITELTALCREHPLRERLRLLLMRALHAGGRTAEALDVFADARTALVEASGIEPGPELRQLQQQLLTGDVRAEPTVEPAWRTHRAGVHVGHKAELAVLRTAMNDVLAGRGGVVWIDGEPGIGKSALVAEALAGVPIPAKRLRWANAQELDSGLPMRFANDLLGVGGDTAAVLEAVERICVDGPLTVVADDLQWADEASMSAWWRLATRVDRLPLLLIGCTRPAPGTAVHAKVRRHVAAVGRTFTLEPLSTEDSYRLAEKLTGAPPEGRLRGWLDDAAGNPYYVRKIVATVAGELLGGAGVPTQDDRGLPPQLVSWVDDHLSFLSTPTMALLRWARLLGKEFTLTDLAAASGERPAALTEPLDEALTVGVLAATGDRLRFRHPLVARALYEKTPNAIRVALHHQVAEALVEAGAPAVRVAEQLTLASTLSGELVGTWLPANIGAVAAEEPEIAVRLLRLAITSTAPPRTRETLTAMLIRLLFWLGTEPEAEARSLIARTTDPTLVAELRWVLAYGYGRRDRVDDACHEVERALSEGPTGVWRDRHELLRAALGAPPAQGPPGLGEYRLLDEDTRAALEHAGATVPATTWQLAVHRALPAELHMTNAMNHFWNGRWDAAQTELDIIAAAAADPAAYVRRPVVAIAVAGASALLAAHRGDRDAAFHLLRTTRRHGQADGDTPLAVVHAARALLAELAGRPRDALDELAAILDTTELPVPWYRWLPDLARLVVLAGDRDRADRLRAIPDEPSLPVEARMMLTYCRGLLAEDPAALREVITFCRMTGGLELMRAHALADLAWLLGRQGEAREAQEVLGDALECYRLFGAVADLDRTDAGAGVAPRALV
ncbi:BTAD domain-containing putative transcriptional regulator [Actinophytocola oryzae]|uniref:DNA-binding SARP family transcriptional activator n=1 Tax=Actinophytocola oryzae TaxID=502181 RepID=A0A4R7VQL0_9PSEU|nr:BTAD domain-containing putative transcriptional regulator [Actinophytocola oryzae]TDV52040.1 DNA-binding SARP family transcriptional activator [Actinophytocola oryzae]